MSEVQIRRADDRGRTNLDWLDSRHSFSFGSYRDPAHMGFRSLRVINDDMVGPGGGFPTHSHQDMEILSYIVDGALEHRDSLGTGSVIHAGEVQRMTAGVGVTHSEYNHSEEHPVRFLQIWFLPLRRGLQPGYEQKAFGKADKHNRLRLIASLDGRDGSVTVHQDASVYLAALDAGAEVEHELEPGRHAYVQVISGAVHLGDQTLGWGDGAAITDADVVRLQGVEDGEVMLFDLA
jgi:redox-sensitive bicupin YhaK (pirin superfamily)